MKFEIDLQTILLIGLLEISEPIWSNIPGWLIRHFILLKRFGKMDEADVEIIEGYRILTDVAFDDIESNDDNREASNNNWTQDTLEKLRKRYGSNKLRIIDTISRKVLVHMYGFIVKLTFFSFLGARSTKSQITIFSITMPCYMMWYLFVMKSKFASKYKIFRIFTFGASIRIRDGHLGYINAAVARMSGSMAVIISSLIVWGIYGDPASENIKIRDGYLFIAQLSFVGLVFGDAFGEIIGAPFGKHQFNVKGLGEVNKKSIEGCIAVFMGTLIPSILLILSNSKYNDQYWLYIASFAGSILCTIVETISFRSTDNLTILISQALFWSTLFKAYDI